MVLQRVVIPLNLQEGEVFPIPPSSLHYLQRVLRLRQGDQFIVMDGRERWRAELQNDRGKVLEKLPQEREIIREVHLAVAMPKGTGMETVLKQTTELGVSRITPIISERTILRPREGKLHRWQKIIQEAAELACLRVLPCLDDPLPLEEFLALDCPHKFIAVTSPAPPLLQLLPQTGAIALLTGPEGGWTVSEEQNALAKGWQPVSLAPSVLSATTAPVVGMGVIACHSLGTSR